MPSSKSHGRSNDFLSPDAVQLRPLRRSCQRVVTRARWIDQNEAHLRCVYDMLQEANASTGRFVFDRETCPFDVFCRVAYANSYKYSKHDGNYDSDFSD